MTLCVNFYDKIPPLNQIIAYFVQDFKFSLDHNGPIWSIISKMWNICGNVMTHHDINLSDITTTLELIFHKVNEENS